MRRCAIVLLHHPVLDSRGAIVTTAVTNLDVHDLARSARTFGCSDYFVVHPVTAQRDLVNRIRGHWLDGPGGDRIPDRREALGVLRVVASLENVFTALGGRDRLEVWATAARAIGRSTSFAVARERFATDGKTVALVFGTGWGVAPAIVAESDLLLEPIRAVRGDYNHLSVRAACAIALDRLFGER
ncbi:MAG: RNA methyltransferase [Polyangiaceae bacterium]|jgi:hypothetical protein